MALNLTHFGSRLRQTLPLDRLLENIGVASSGCFRPSGERGASFKSVTQVPGRWTPQRIKLAQRLWGENFVEPGGVDGARRTFARVATTEAQSALDLTSGLGGTALTLARDRGLSVNVFEPDHQLASEAAKTEELSGRDDRERLEHRRLESSEIVSGSYDLIYTRERLFEAEEKNELLEAAARGLKPGGSFVITDIVVDSPEIMDTTEYCKWAGTEPVVPRPWTIGLYGKVLQNFGLTIVGRQDLTKEYLNAVHDGWHSFARSLEGGRFDRELSDDVLAEGAVWAGRVDAFSAGVISFCRVVAQRPA